MLLTKNHCMLPLLSRHGCVSHRSRNALPSLAPVPMFFNSDTIRGLIRHTTDSFGPTVGSLPSQSPSAVRAIKNFNRHQSDPEKRSSAIAALLGNDSVRHVVVHADLGKTLTLCVPTPVDDPTTDNDDTMIAMAGDIITDRSLYRVNPSLWEQFVLVCVPQRVARALDLHQEDILPTDCLQGGGADPPKEFWPPQNPDLRRIVVRIVASLMSGPLAFFSSRPGRRPPGGRT